VVRFWNNDVLSNIDGVLMLLDQALRADGQTAD
jgi:very-short-patch-repair endonuclease